VIHKLGLKLSRSANCKCLIHSNDFTVTILKLLPAFATIVF